MKLYLKQIIIFLQGIINLAILLHNLKAIYLIILISHLKMIVILVKILKKLAMNQINKKLNKQIK